MVTFESNAPLNNGYPDLRKKRSSKNESEIAELKKELKSLKDEIKEINVRGSVAVTGRAKNIFNPVGLSLDVNAFANRERYQSTATLQHMHEQHHRHHLDHNEIELMSHAKSAYCNS